MKLQQHSIQTTLVSCAVVIERTTVLVEFTDGSLRQYALRMIPAKNSYAMSERALCWKTPEAIAREVYEFNEDARLIQNQRLFEDKVRRLGWDHERRGY